MLSFICGPCWTEKVTDEYKKEFYHAHCKGGTWCDCQHKVGQKNA